MKLLCLFVCRLLGSKVTYFNQLLNLEILNREIIDRKPECLLNLLTNINKFNVNLFISVLFCIYLFFCNLIALAVGCCICASCVFVISCGPGLVLVVPCIEQVNTHLSCVRYRHVVVTEQKQLTCPSAAPNITTSSRCFLYLIFFRVFVDVRTLFRHLLLWMCVLSLHSRLLSE